MLGENWVQIGSLGVALLNTQGDEIKRNLPQKNTSARITSFALAN